MITGQPDTDEDRDVYGQRLGPSAESLDAVRSSAPNLSDLDVSQYTTGSDPCPAWDAERNIPLSKEDRESAKVWLSKCPNSISRCTCLTAVRRECLPARHTLPFTRITLGNIRVTAKVVLCCPARSRRCCRSYSKLRSNSKRGGGRKHSEESLTQCPKMLASGNEQNVPV